MTSARLIVLFILLVLGCFQEGEAIEGRPQQSCKMGAYLISLYDLDISNESFGADLWFWSICDNKSLNPLQVMDIVNAKQINRSLAATSDRGGTYWSYVKVSGTFRQSWDVQNYPFDRHDLHIVTEHTEAPASEFSYTIDKKGSRLSKDIRLEGWKITDFKIEERSYFYDTDFGDPATQQNGKSEYSRIIISLSITRTNLLRFFKLSMGVYVAVALSVLTFLSAREKAPAPTS